MGRMHDPSARATSIVSFDPPAAKRSRISRPILFILWAAAALGCGAAELRVGTASIGITPDKPVALDGQFETRISRGVDNPITATAVALEVCELTRRELRTDVPFAHHVEELVLPARKVTEPEVAEAKKETEALKRKGDTSRRAAWHEALVERYRTQGAAPTFTVEVHVLRIGDIAIATSPFELYHDYGVQIKSRSKALRTFVLELTGGWGGYLPTSRVLVDRTVELINGF